MLHKSLYQCERLEIPVESSVGDELIGMWEEVLGGDFSFLREILAGREAAQNHDVLYLARREREIIASCRLTKTRGNQRLGSLGEVATRIEHRRNDLARRLCAWAAEDFDRACGKGLFLATSNPVAAKLYGQLGWRRMAGTTPCCESALMSAPKNSWSISSAPGRTCPYAFALAGHSFGFRSSP